MEHLTSLQQKLVEDNHNLIYGVAYKNKIDLDEYYDVLAIGLCKAAMQFNESRGQFSTFAYKVMLSEYCAILRHNNTTRAIPKDMVISIYTEIDIGSETLINLVDILQSCDDVESDIVLKDYVDFFRNKLQKQQDKDIVTSLANGMTQTEIAKSFGVSRQYVSQRLDSIQKRLQRFVA